MISVEFFEGMYTAMLDQLSRGFSFGSAHSWIIEVHDCQEARLGPTRIPPNPEPLHKPDAPLHLRNRKHFKSPLKNPGNQDMLSADQPMGMFVVLWPVTLNLIGSLFLRRMGPA